MNSRKLSSAPAGLRTNLVLLLVTVLITLCAGEVVARFFLPAPRSWKYPQLRYRENPDLVFSLLPNQRSFSADVPVEINKSGLRGPTIPYVRKQDGAVRLLFLGDSITFGYGVSDEQTVSAVVARSLSGRGIKNEVINAGVPGYNTEQEVNYLQQEGVRYSPDWIILGFCWNDLSEKSGVKVNAEGMLLSAGQRDPKGLARAMESKYGYAIRNLVKQLRILYAASQGWRVLHSSGAVDRVSGYRSEVLSEGSSKRVEEGWARVGSSLARLKEIAQRGGVRVLVVAYPTVPTLEVDHSSGGYPSRLKSLCESLGLDYLDLEVAFRAKYKGRDSLFIPFDPDHPNASGHALAAQAISDFLLNDEALGTSAGEVGSRK